MDKIKKTRCHHKLHQETALISWKDLQLFFAKGVLYHVKEEVDLIKIAGDFVLDDTKSLQLLVEQKKIMKPAAELAKQWFEKKAILWAVVVAPFVLVQLSHYDDKIER